MRFLPSLPVAVGFALLCLALCLGFPERAAAQKDMIGFSTTEQVGFAFYHLINRNPPVIDWVLNRDDYKKAKPNVQMDIMDHERVRLSDGFEMYSPERDLITVKAPLQFDAGENPDYKTDPAAQREGLTKRVMIHFPAMDNGHPYFPFQLGKLWIGLIPQNIEAIFTQDMTDTQFRSFCESIGDCSNFKNKNLNTTMILKPIEADAKTPMMDGDLPIWLLLAKVGALYVTVGGKPIAWNYTAPWYSKDRTQSLMTLYGD